MKRPDDVCRPTAEEMVQQFDRWRTIKLGSWLVLVFNTKADGLADIHLKYAASFPENSVTTGLTALRIILVWP